MARSTNLRVWLKRHGLVQSDLAMILQVSDRCVRMWVAGDRLPHYLTLLMKAVDDERIPISWLAEFVQKREAA